MTNQLTGPLQEDQTIATAGGTYATGGIKVTVTKCSQLVIGSLQTQMLGAGFIVTPVKNSEVANTATMQCWEPGLGTAPMIELANGSTSLIGQVVRMTYQGS